MAAIRDLGSAVDARSFALTLTLLCLPQFVFSQGIFVEKVRVRQASELDWPYAAEQLGFPAAAREGMEDYKADRQLYDCFGPRLAPSRALSLILFVSPGNVPLEWKQFAPVCRKHGVLFAGVRGAGNTQDPAVRVRAAVEVLDDVRRRYRVDADRTYVAGFSGGATIASKLAFALPECFGGLLCMGQRVFLPRSDALTVRAGERIQIAALCGGNELVGPEVEHIDRHLASAYGFRCRSFVSRGGGHRMPKAEVIEAAFIWLERGVEHRRELAETYGSTRLDSKRAYNAAKWRRSLLNEADQRRAAGEFSAAATLLNWIQTRWPESEASQQASSKLQEFEQQPELADRLASTAEERKLKIDEALAAGYERLAQDRRSWFTREHRARYAQKAIHLLEALGLDGEELSERLEELRKTASKGKM